MIEIEMKKGKWLNDNYPSRLKAEHRKVSVATIATEDLPDTMPVPDDFRAGSLGLLKDFALF
jgi:hypothetical protein